MKKTVLVLGLTLSVGCGTLSPPKPPELPGQAISPVRRFVVASLTRATQSDEVFDGVSIQTLDAADVATGAISDLISQRTTPLLSGIISGLISAQRIEARGPRAWEISVKGDPAGATRWFILRPGVRGSTEVPTLPTNQPVRVYAQRIEVPGFSALIVTRWSKL